jgi:enamine deaminase RidA (YjgF/YER057c/UK114 family)
MDRRTINPWSWQDGFGYVQAHEVIAPQRVLYCAGQGAVDADGAPMHVGDMGAQISQTLDNLETVLIGGGYSLTDVVRLTIYTTDMEQFLAAYDVFATRLAAGDCRPSCSLMGVTRLAIPTMLVEIEATAVR